jgi:hypothetical protein
MQKMIEYIIRNTSRKLIVENESIIIKAGKTQPKKPEAMVWRKQMFW